MAMMEALLKIKADVQGEGRINALGKALGGLNNTAGQVSNGLKGMVGGLSGVAGAMGTLTPLLSAAGLIGMAKASIEAGNQMYDLSQKTGVSVEMLAKLKKAATGTGTDIEAIGASMIKLSKSIAASVESTVSSAVKAAGGSTGQLQNSLAGQVAMYEQNQQRLIAAVKTGADRQVAEIQNREQKQIDAVRAGMERAIDVVKAGEQKQIDAIDRAAEQRINRLERETDARLREINRRYRQEEKLLNDSYDDARGRAQQAADDELRVLERRIERRYDAQRKAIQADKSLSDGAREAQLQTLQDQQEDELKVLRNGFSEKAKVRDRQFRDQQERDQQAIDDRKRTEEEAEKARTDALKRQVQDRAKVEKDAVSKMSAERQTEIKKQAAEEERVIKAGAAAATKAIKEAAAQRVKALTDSGAQAKDAFKKLGIELLNSDGTIRKSEDVLIDLANKFKTMPDGVEKTAMALQLFGKSGAGMIPLLNKGGDAIDKIKVKMTEGFAQASDQYDKNLKALGGKIGAIGADVAKVLLPALDAVTTTTTAIVGIFDKLPGPIKAIVGGIVLISALFVALSPFIAATAAAITALGAGLTALNLGATIAGWAGIIGPAVTTIIGLLGGILTWVTGTLLPGLLAVFSGPVGWTVLAVAAVVAMVIAFRKPLGEFLMWLWQWSEPFRQFWVDVWNAAPQAASNALVSMQKAFTGLGSWMAGIWSSISKGFSQYVVQPISNAWNALIQALPSAMAKGVQFVQNTWTGMINAIRGALRGFLVSIANAVNAVVGVVNRVIGGFNNLPGPDIPFVPTLQVPQFAKGGVVNRATLAMVGEGGEREYIVPESKMGRVSAAYLSGSRGAQVFKQSQSLMRAPLRRMPQSATLTNRPISINVKTGPVMEFQGERYVKLEELDRAMRITAEGVMGRLRTPAARVALGIR